MGAIRRGISNKIDTIKKGKDHLGFQSVEEFIVMPPNTKPIAIRNKKSPKYPRKIIFCLFGEIICLDFNTIKTKIKRNTKAKWKKKYAKIWSDKTMNS
jgi:hypothetical protein